LKGSRAQGRVDAQRGDVIDHDIHHQVPADLSAQHQ